MWLSREKKTKNNFLSKLCNCLFPVKAHWWFKKQKKKTIGFPSVQANLEDLCAKIRLWCEGRQDLIFILVGTAENPWRNSNFETRLLSASASSVMTSSLVLSFCLSSFLSLFLSSVLDFTVMLRYDDIRRMLLLNWPLLHLRHTKLCCHLPRKAVAALESKWLRFSKIK